jgi:hypothetical protein
MLSVLLKDCVNVRSFVSCCLMELKIPPERSTVLSAELIFVLE